MAKKNLNKLASLLKDRILWVSSPPNLGGAYIGYLLSNSVDLLENGVKKFQPPTLATYYQTE